MNSSIYESIVHHSRFSKNKNQFAYKLYNFHLDLDELDELDQKLWLFSRNRFAIFSFYDKDHIQFGGSNIRENVERYVRDQGYTGSIGRITLLTNLRILGYVFNPVSFYYIYDKSDNAVCAIAEVGNTFGEIKPYFFPSTDSGNFDFRLRVDKFFYVSPYIALDSEFDFKLKIPNDRLHIQVDSYEKSEKTLATAFTGKKKPLLDRFLLFYFLKYPLVTVKVIGAIHLQALKLYLYKVPFLRKGDNQELQRGAQLGKSS
ncbi:DUF1365 domain-containing protein [Leptospira sp. GIMC2001]|uniref:DUF1365 domain-containing protein n=1 Tax=Leptospira sp. GIMC2001 TaxID=1513297 RepID=UPI002348EFBE|nr:DUF1365 domain-containing protein [Leptospira sp. GIMC2001]WCL47768.1 DUF1365 domain-containing protein [Leptospira sp. GIMC2001]